MTDICYKVLRSWRVQHAILEKTSWWGCGNHIPSVMDKILVEERCTCEPKIKKEGKEYPPMAAKAIDSHRDSALHWWPRSFEEEPDWPRIYIWEKLATKVRGCVMDWISCEERSINFISIKRLSLSRYLLRSDVNIIFSAPNPSIIFIHISSATLMALLFTTS